MMCRRPRPFQSQRIPAEILRAERANDVVTRVTDPGAAPGGPAHQGASYAPVARAGAGQVHSKGEKAHQPGFISPIRAADASPDATFRSYVSQDVKPPCNSPSGARELAAGRFSAMI